MVVEGYGYKGRLLTVLAGCARSLPQPAIASSDTRIRGKQNKMEPSKETAPDIAGV
jgi:hypothetical protein